jgi:hypothetical protein
VALLLAWFVAMPRGQAVTGLPAPGAEGLPDGRWRESPEYVALFAPRLYRDAYRALTSPVELDALLQLVSTQHDTIQAPDSWRPRQENALDTFGAGGTYDRWKLARLYGSRRPTVARGPRGRNGIVEEMWTLVSPYPSADLDRLESGTLLIVLRVP